MANKLQLHIQKITEFNKDRITWLRLSGFVVITIILLALDWIVGDKNLNWVLVISGLTLSAAWWYWTMKLVKELLNNKITEMEILSSIVSDIKEIKNDIKKIDQSP